MKMKPLRLPTALTVLVLGLGGCSGNNNSTDAGNDMNVLLSDGGCACSNSCVAEDGFCVANPADDGGTVCECEVA